MKSRSPEKLSNEVRETKGEKLPFCFSFSLFMENKFLCLQQLPLLFMLFNSKYSTSYVLRWFNCNVILLQLCSGPIHA